MTENVQFLKDLRKMAQMQDQYGQEEPQYWVAGEYRGAASVERNRNISTEYQPNKTMFLTKESAVIARYRLAKSAEANKDVTPVQQPGKTMFLTRKAAREYIEQNQRQYLYD